MKVSLHWLREFVELPATTQQLVDLLTLAGVEVEKVEQRGVALPNVVVAEIAESAQHPNADRLSVCKVNDGTAELRQIVCGAKNYRVGDHVPLALPGAVLPGEFKIKVGKLRGVESHGMLCSAEELGLPKGADGLLILSREAKPGSPIGELFPADTILDLEITPNRPDLLSHAGIALEIAALTGGKMKWPAWNREVLNGEEELPVAVEVAARTYYTARFIRGVKVGPSPDWLRTKLEAVGQRSINNIVDVTNYILLGYGQPLHAFDAGKIVGGLRVRSAAPREIFRALDGKSYELSATDLVIADDRQALAIAGVIGGEASAVTNDTTDLVLESAYFDPATIRRTARRLGISTDSSYRFERGVDLANVLIESDYAAHRIADVSGAASVHRKCVAHNDPAFAKDWHKGSAPIALRAERLHAVLGTAISSERVDQILSGFQLEKSEAGWAPPSRRSDLTREIDLIEEIARVIGIDSIPAREQSRFAPASASDREYDRAMDLRRACVAQGLHEARSLTLVPAQPLGLAFTRVEPANVRRVKNPMIDDQVVLRPNLLHGLLTGVSGNVRAGSKTVRLFEVGRVYSAAVPEESTHLALVVSGVLAERSWRGSANAEADLFHLKGMLTQICGSELSFESDDNPSLALAMTLKLAGKVIGFAGQLWPADARALDADAPVLFAELDLAAFFATRATRADAKRYREIPKFPATTRDIAIVAPAALSHDEVLRVIHGAKELLLSEVELFDLFTDPRGEKLAADKKSLAYALTYRAPDRTLTADEANAAHARLKERLKSELGVTLRES